MIRTLFNKKTIDDDIIYTLNEDVYYRVKTDKETKTINEKLEEIESELNEIDIVPTIDLINEGIDELLFPKSLTISI